MKHIAFLLMMAGTPVFASCPASPDIAADLQVLIAQANGAEPTADAGGNGAGNGASEGDNVEDVDFEEVK